MTHAATDGDMLYRAILADPGNDTPRLVYADWLQENAVSVPCRACESRHYVVDIATLECAACGGTGSSCRPRPNDRRANYSRTPTNTRLD